MAGRARLIVGEDRNLLALDAYEEIQIVTAEAFHQMLDTAR
jgi:predicted nucleic acid-binding protein